MAEADRLAIAGGVAGIDADGARGRGGRRGRRGALSRPAAGSSSSPGRATTAATASWRRGCSPSAAIRCASCWSATPSRLKGDAALAAQELERAGRGCRARARSHGADVVIDALFGAGLDRPVEGAAAGDDRGMNAQAAPVVAVDLPSGINGTSGAVMGAAVKAARTVTFFRKKPGHCCCPGGFIAARCRSPISAFRRACCDASARRHSRTVPRCGARISRCRASTGTNTTAAMRSSSPVRPGRPARRGSPRAGRCAPARDW